MSAPKTPAHIRERAYSVPEIGAVVKGGFHDLCRGRVLGRGPMDGLDLETAGIGCQCRHNDKTSLIPWTPRCKSTGDRVLTHQAEANGADCPAGDGAKGSWSSHGEIWTAVT